MSLRSSSLISLKKADVATKLAAKEGEFNAIQEHVQHKEETVRMEGTLAQRKAELEQMEVRKQMETTRARLMVYQVVEEAEENVNPAKDDLLYIPPTQSEPKTMSAPSHQSPLVEHSTGVSVNASRTEPQPIPLQSQGVNLPPAHGQEIIAAITDSVNLSHFQGSEPNVLSGELIKYPDWQSPFCDLIDRRNLTSSDKM
ncbi:hypothetical protein P5673_007820 [Acropora cervicornis]|uniref:Uncharacterized protein n=1 Tax=Acropora cervicornis TaxID=6130 RepID=A0AAD9QV41_ACRCE|nr:hypothetical protein P5673_007820 [Acropora cervicornis]